MTPTAVVEKMEVFQDKLCIILDLEGFFLNKTFHVRELSYYSWNEQHGRHAFFIPVPHETLNNKDKRTVDFVKTKIHGLTYRPTPEEHFQNPLILGILVQTLYDNYKTDKRNVVGYKGGHIEKDLLQKLNIPSLNLETLGCPKYNVSRTRYEHLTDSCGFHADPTLHHCPVVECHAFWKWYKDELK